jgi:hypothetical protein
MEPMTWSAIPLSSLLARGGEMKCVVGRPVLPVASRGSNGGTAMVPQARFSRGDEPPGDYFQGKEPLGDGLVL